MTPQEAEDAWRRVSLLTAQLDWMEAEDAEMEAHVEEAGARAAALRDGAVRLSLDVSLAYRLKNGQVGAGWGWRKDRLHDIGWMRVGLRDRVRR